MALRHLARVKGITPAWGPLFLACLLILSLAQMLMGGLSLAALQRLQADNTAQKFDLYAAQTVERIQLGLNLGKSLEQYYGLQQTLEQLQRRLPQAQYVAVVSAQGKVIRQAGAPPAWLSEPTRLLTTAAASTGLSLAGQVEIALPFLQNSAVSKASPIAWLVVAGHSTLEQRVLRANLILLAVLTVVAAAAMTLVLRRCAPQQTRWARMAYRFAPVVILLAAQMLYAVYTIYGFQHAWQNIAQERAAELAQSVQSDLERLVSYGVMLEQRTDLEHYLSQRAASSSLIEKFTLSWSDQPLDSSLANSVQVLLSLPVRDPATDHVVAILATHINQQALQSSIHERVWEALTVAVASGVAALELLLLLRLWHQGGYKLPIGRLVTGLTQVATERLPLLARPIMFAFLFAWAMPIGFLPLYAGQLLPPGLEPEQQSFWMALPITVEMGCGLLAALCAGRWSDRHGWSGVVLSGLVLSIAMAGLSAWAPDMTTFLVARGGVGFAYGLSWMGLQGFVVQRSPVANRGHNMASIVAGIFAGYLSGAALGAMLVQQYGAPVVFVSSALLFVFPLLGVWALRRWSQHSPPVARPAPPAQDNRRGRISSLLACRGFSLLLLACVIPFSLAQVGLLNYAVPLYLAELGAPTAAAGRVLMLYGLCVIYVGPLMGRWADRKLHTKYYLIAAGGVASVGLMLQGTLGGVWGIALATLCLALSSCLAAGAQAAYMLALGPVQHYGAVGASSVLRAADKVGQMLGPVVIAILLAAGSMSTALFYLGLVYALLTLCFMLFAPPQEVKADNGAAPSR